MVVSEVGISHVGLIVTDVGLVNSYAELIITYIGEITILCLHMISLYVTCAPICNFRENKLLLLLLLETMSFEGGTDFITKYDISLDHLKQSSSSLSSRIIIVSHRSINIQSHTIVIQWSIIHRLFINRLFIGQSWIYRSRRGEGGRKRGGGARGGAGRG